MDALIKQINFIHHLLLSDSFHPLDRVTLVAPGEFLRTLVLMELARHYLGCCFYEGHLPTPFPGRPFTTYSLLCTLLSIPNIPCCFSTDGAEEIISIFRNETLNYEKDLFDDINNFYDNYDNITISNYYNIIINHNIIINNNDDDNK